MVARTAELQLLKPTAHLCRFQTEMNRSAPLPMGYPLGSPLSGAGSVSSPRALLIRIGGCG